MKPILFNTDMVKAMLEGRKTHTRRLGGWKIGWLNIDRNGAVTATVYKESKKGKVVKHYGGGDIKQFIEAFSDYKVNDVLYVRETWQNWTCIDCDWECVPDNGSGCCTTPKYIYKASDEETDKGWKPSIHMPKKAARIFLRVTNVRVERLQDITLDDVSDEGIVIRPEAFNDPDNAYLQGVSAFGNLWDSTIKKDQLNRYGWEANPYVWVIEFERIDKPEEV